MNILWLDKWEYGGGAHKLDSVYIDEKCVLENVIYEMNSGMKNYVKVMEIKNELFKALWEAETTW